MARAFAGRAQIEITNTESSPQRTHYFDYAIDLSESEYEEYLQARQALYTFKNDTELFIIVIWNYEDYFRTLNTYLAGYTNHEPTYPDNRDPYLNINRCFLNYLAAVRTYLDHMETSLKRQHGRDSEILENFKTQCANAYDSYFSYRFLYKLRNYSQHCGLPLDMRFRTEPDKDNPQEPIHILEVSVNRDNLLNNYNEWGATIKKDLKACPLTIPINRHINTTMHCLLDIDSSIHSKRLPILREHANCIRQLVAQLPQAQGDPCVFTFPEGTTSPLTAGPINISSIPIDLANAIADNRIEDITPYTITGSPNP